MFKTARIVVLSCMFKMFSLMAFATAASASIWGHHQPKLPECLKE